MVTEEILVSVYCLCYNHEKFIRDALDGFIGQKTTFKYEVIVHDDASTDGSQAIIKEYAEKFPDLIIPILQTENQYSKKISILQTFMFPIVRGKYIALCEGDDFWIESNKLQCQIDYMEAHPECSLSFHNAKVVNPNGDYIRQFLPYSPVYKKYYKNETGVYTIEDMILLDFAPTNSLVYRVQHEHNLPAYYNNGVCEDLPIRIYQTSKGYAYYFKDVMSAYRIGVQGSATERGNKSIDTQRYVMKKHQWILDEFDKSTNYICTQSIQEAKKIKEYLFYYNIGDKRVLSNKYREYFSEFSRKDKLKFFCRVYFPHIYILLKRINKRVRGY